MFVMFKNSSCRPSSWNCLELWRNPEGYGGNWSPVTTIKQKAAQKCAFVIWTKYFVSLFLTFISNMLKPTWRNLESRNNTFIIKILFSTFELVITTGSIVMWFVIIMPQRQLNEFEGYGWNRPISQIPQYIRQISHNTSFCNTKVLTCAFL